MTRKTIELFSGERDRAVSPVIGVILMVAITVILAAVIGTFVLGLGENVSTSTPQAQLTLSADTSGANGSIYVDHKGGDPIPVGDIEVVVTDANDGKSTFKPSASKSGELTVGGSAEINLSDGNLTWGDSTIPVESAGAKTTNEPVNVQIIHKPSDQLILDRQVRP